MMGYTVDDTIAIWRSSVNRWHANPWPALRNSGDTTDAHQGRCVRLLVCLHPSPSAELIAAAACHDVQECVTGDVPGPAKTGRFGSALASLEAEISAAFGLPVAIGDDAEWIELVDMLDAILWMRAHDGRAERYGEDWISMEVQVRHLADRLGCGIMVGQLLDATAPDGQGDDG